MGQASAKRVENHITAMEGAGYTINEQLASKLRNSLNKLNMASDDDGQLVCILPVPVDMPGLNEGTKKEAQSQSSLQRPKFFLNCYNGSHIVLPLLYRLEWNRVMDRREIGHCCFRWTETVMQLNYQVFRECEQMVNHIPNCGLFTNKLGLLMSLRNYANESKSNLRKDVSINFIPETYWIDDAKEKTEFVNKLTDNQMWIMKPCGLNQGKGICLIRSKEDFARLDDEHNDELRRNPHMWRPRIVQKYLTSPLLLNQRKFDIRCYLMIASTMPYLVLFAPGYIRLSLRKYDLADTNLITHLTNQYIQKKDPNYDKSKDDSVWTFRKLNEYINTYVAPNKHLPKNWVTRHLLPEMHRITTQVFNAVKDKLACRIGFFEIYGMDFMIDDNMKVWLIEINSNPAMNTNCEVLRQVIPPIVNRFIQISIECFEKARRWQPILPILGIIPRSQSEIGEGSDSPPWNVSLRPPPRSITNGGLPASFTILFNESLMAAKSRQGRCYSIPLRLWVPPKIYLTVRLPKPGLVIRRSASPPSHSSAPLRRTSSLTHKPSTSMAVARTGFQRPSPPGIRVSSFSRASSYSHRISSRSDSFRHSVERQPASTAISQESPQKQNTTSHCSVQKTNDLSESIEAGNDLQSLKAIKSEGNKGSNECNSFQGAIFECEFKESKGPIEMDVLEPFMKDEIVMNNNSSASAHTMPKRRKLKKNRNDSCSVKIPPLVPEFMIVPISPLVVPPIPPLVLAATLLTELPNEEAGENATNNANVFNDLLAV